jgi:hypothetical protein
MTSGQRKAHRYIWLVLAILIPIIIGVSVKDLSIFSTEEHLEIVSTNNSKTILKTVENELVKVSIVEQDSITTVEIILKKPLKHPSSSVFTVKNDKRGYFIGQLNSVGIYNFKVTTIPKGIIVYDDIKETKITKIMF